MSARRFSQVPLKLWDKSAFRALSDSAKLALLFYWAGPHSTSAGISVVKDAYAQADLGWSSDQWSKARCELEDAALISFDPDTQTVLVAGYLQANPPANPRMRSAIIAQISGVECDALRERAEAEFAVIESAVAKRAAKVQAATGGPNNAEDKPSDLSPQMKQRVSEQAAKFKAGVG